MKKFKNLTIRIWLYVLKMDGMASVTKNHQQATTLKSILMSKISIFG